MRLPFPSWTAFARSLSFVRRSKARKKSGSLMYKPRFEQLEPRRLLAYDVFQNSSAFEGDDFVLEVVELDGIATSFDWSTADIAFVGENALKTVHYEEASGTENIAAWGTATITIAGVDNDLWHGDILEFALVVDGENFFVQLTDDEGPPIVEFTNSYSEVNEGDDGEAVIHLVGPAAGDKVFVTYELDQVGGVATGLMPPHNGTLQGSASVYRRSDGSVVVYGEL